MRTAETIEASVKEPSAQPKSGKRKQHPNSLKNLVAPWKPGDVPNPGGKNQHDVAQEIAKAIFTRNPELIYKAFAKKLGEGSAYAFQVVSDRAFGKLKETKEITHRYDDVPDSDLQARLDQLLKDLGLAAQVDQSAVTNK